MHDKWIPVRFPLNDGSYHDIPRDARLHQSLICTALETITAISWSLVSSVEGLPASFVKVDEVREAQERDPMHQIWGFKQH